MRTPTNVELHVAHACNLACESCSHYSNHAHKGILALDEADRWMAHWSGRIQPKTISLLGGEPTINPRLAEFVDLAGRHWPRSRLRLVTNGILLHRHPQLPLALKRHPNAFLSISIHHDDQEYLRKLQPMVDLVRSWVAEHGIRASTSNSHENWTRRYKGFGSEMEPYQDAQPRQSWEICPARKCLQLYEGKLWKCGPITYLRLQQEKYELSPSWDPYLAYQPLEPGCSDEALDEFLARKEESCCGMCPATPHPFKLPIPLRRAERASDKPEPAEQGARAQ